MTYPPMFQYDYTPKSIPAKKAVKRRLSRPKDNFEPYRSYQEDEAEERWQESQTPIRRFVAWLRVRVWLRSDACPLGKLWKRTQSKN